MIKTYLRLTLFVISLVNLCSCEHEDHMQQKDLPSDTVSIMDCNDPGGYTLYENIHLYLDGSMPGALSYLWLPGGETNAVIPFIPNDYHYLENQAYCDGTYLGAYDLQVTYTDTIIIYHCFVDLMESTIYCPSAFSPNKDGKNDFWQVYAGVNISIDELAIYDQNYRKVYFMQNQSFNAWDGRFKGEPCLPGDYFYYVHYSSTEGSTHSSQGILHLL